MKVDIRPEHIESLKYIGDNLGFKDLESTLEFILDTAIRILEVAPALMDTPLTELYRREHDLDALHTCIYLGNFLYSFKIADVVRELGFEYPPIIELIEFVESPYQLRMYMSIKKYVNSRDFGVKFRNLLFEEDYEVCNVSITYFLEGIEGELFAEFIESNVDELEEWVINKYGGYLDYNVERLDENNKHFFNISLVIGEAGDRPNIVEFDRFVWDMFRERSEPL